MSMSLRSGLLGKPRVRASSFIVLATFGLLITTGLLAIGPNYISNPPTDHVKECLAVATFLADVMLVAAIVCGFGYAVTGYPSGIAISSWNDYSLSKLQMALWTIVVLAALFTVSKIRLLGYFGVVSDPLAISIPGDLLAAMGIAGFTTAATPAILTLKSSQLPGPGEIEAARERLTGSPSSGTVVNIGKAVSWVDPLCASWTDIVTGDEAANAGMVDLSKVQQLLITLLLVGIYIGLLVHMFAHATTCRANVEGGSGPAHCGIDGLPLLGSSFVGLLALSHAGYLAYKATPKSGYSADLPISPNAAAPSLGLMAAVRVAVEDAANIRDLQLEVDHRAQSIGSDGFAEIALELGLPHTIAVRGVRAGLPVSGSLTITPTADDMNKPLSIGLR